MTRVIGLSGGIGTGKSTVARIFEELGAVVLDEIAQAFGEQMILADGSLDRDRLGEAVFGDEAARKRLNAIVHPRVGAEMARRLAAARESQVPLVLLDIPLLFETMRGAGGGSANLVEETVLVYATRAQQIERQIARDGRTEAEAAARVAAQMPIDDKRALADHVIENDGDRDETRAQVGALYEKLLD